LNPIILTLEQLDDLCKNDGINKYIQTTFEGVDQCKKEILRKLHLPYLISKKKKTKRRKENIDRMGESKVETDHRDTNSSIGVGKAKQSR
jgi:hypothetical protein